MKLNNIEAQGFRSFTEPQVLDVTSLPPGLYHVAGDNGAGKSSLFETFNWVYTGETSRGLSARAVKHWTSQEKCAVIFDGSTVDGLPIQILRMWQPNTLEISLDGSASGPIDQKELEQVMGVPPSAFTHSIYFPQYPVPYFADLKPAEQTVLFSSVLGLEVWENASSNATADAGFLEQTLQTANEQLAKLTGQAEEMAAWDYATQEATWARDLEERITTAVRIKTQHGFDVTAAEASVRAAAAGSVEFRRLRDLVDVASRLVQDAGHEERRIEKNIAGLRAKDRTTCPACGAPVSNDHILKELASAERELSIAHAQAEARLLEHTLAIKEMTKHRQAEVDLLNAQTALADAGAELKTAERTLANTKLETNPYTPMRVSAEARGEKLVTDMETLGKEMDVLRGELAAARYWIKGFKEVRLSIIRESLVQLTVEVNESVFQLGLRDWSIEFDIERENKSGGISRNFNIAITAPGSPAAVPWRSWSGGESQRLRLAITMGFANLICAKLGMSPNLEMWDEPSNGLNEEGIQAMLRVFAERAARLKKVVLLADHRTLDFGGFTGIIEVRKETNGSHINVRRTT